MAITHILMIGFFKQVIVLSWKEHFEIFATQLSRFGWKSANFNCPKFDLLV